MNRRLLALLLIPIALIAAGVADGRRDRPVRGTQAPAIQAVGDFTPPVAPRTADNTASYTPVLRGPSALDAAWFCAAGTATGDGNADAVVVIANTGSAPANATVQAVTNATKRASKSVRVGAHASARVRLADLVQGPWAAATVLTDHGGVAVSLVVGDGGGTVATPCASRASSSWYFAGGDTDAGATEDIALYNPYPEDASASIQLETPDGARQPPKLQGIPVPAHSLVVERISDIERRRELVSATVVVPVGRVVASRIQTFDGNGAVGPTGEAPKGLSVALGEPTPSTSWTWPYGTKIAGHSDQYVLYNPGQADAHLRVEVGLTSPGKVGRVSPIPVTVRAGQSQAFDVSKLRQIPDLTSFSVTIRSTNGVRFVAERFAQMRVGDRYGVALSPGAPVRATRWVVPTTDARGGRAYVSIANPGKVVAKVAIEAFPGQGSGETKQVTVPPGDRYDLDLSTLGVGDTLSLRVSADHPVTVSALQELEASLSMAMAIPLQGTTTFP